MFIKSYVLNHIRNKKYHIYTGKDFMHIVNILVPEARPGIKTKIKEKKSILNMTDRIDTAINILLNSGKYNENKVLVIINPYHTAPRIISRMRESISGQCLLKSIRAVCQTAS